MSIDYSLQASKIFNEIGELLNLNKSSQTKEL
jgi:hypothetical protein